MRDYSNMSYHPFLDWRLGLDVARLCLDKNYQMNLQQDHWSSLVNRVEKNFLEIPFHLKRNNNFTSPVFTAEAEKMAFILHHPLALTRGDLGASEHASVIAGL